VVDELIERKAVTKDIKAIGNISDIPVQHSTLYKKSESLTLVSLSFARLSGISLGTITLSTTCASPINVLKLLSRFSGEKSPSLIACNMVNFVIEFTIKNNWVR
jgi:hypothetical protein